GSLPSICRIIDSGTVKVTDVDEQGVTALHYAANGNHQACVKYLIDRGANVDAVAGEMKATPLHWAAR
ncbi:hypothetical protein CLU79DRAFT_702038, partial [Phycomyces nitens]